MTEWTKEEDEAFNQVEKQSNLGKQILNDMGQPSEINVLVNKPVTRLLARKMPT